MVMVVLVPVLVFAALVVFAMFLEAAGSRAGDRRGDATVRAVLGDAGQPDEPRPVVIATIRNPGPVPVLAGLSVRRSFVPERLDPGTSVAVPRRTAWRRGARRRLSATAHATVGVVPAGETAELTVPVRRLGRRYRLTAIIGQDGGRLRVFRLPVAASAEGGHLFRGELQRPGGDVLR
jgi:hypothetical protein